jgi:MOSC domain-containing protein YiiM
MSDDPGFVDLESRWRACSARPATGQVRLLVVRSGGGQHATPARIRLDPASGIHGDRWHQGAQLDPDDQVSLMDARVVEALAGADGLHVPGDNVIVDLDLDEQALPFGVRLRLGTAVIQLSGKLHAGCHKFRARLGDQALRWVNAKQNQGLRLRGVFARILEPGEVAVGDTIVRAPSA